jgi:hypothetical protein
MRRLLLATTAVLGGTMGVASMAAAQTTPAPVPPILQFGAAAADPNAIPSQIFAPFSSVPGTTPAPSTLTVRLDGRINVYAAAVADSGRNPGFVTTAAGTAPVLANSKLSNYTMLNYIRLYPSFDGVSSNGLRYGGYIEFRQDNAVAPGGGINGSISASTRARGALYVRDDFVYVGTPQLGYLRFGSTWGASTLFLTGTFENFNDAGWDGDLPAAFTGNQGLAFPFPDQSYTYAVTKAVYVSPQVAGFDFAASFAPGTGAVNSGSGNCGYANTAAGTSGVNDVAGTGAVNAGCDAASATTALAETTRYRDLMDFELRYRGAFGPIGLTAEAGGIFSGKVAYDGPVTAASLVSKYDGLALGDGGLTVSYGGLAVGGHITAGRGNLTSFSPEASNSKDSFAWIAGTSYAIGPVIVGASYFSLHAPGNEKTTTVAYNGALQTYGIAAGGTYNFAPGMNVFLSYLYGHQHESGTDLVTGTASTAAGHVFTHNNTQAQGASLGLQFRW